MQPGKEAFCSVLARQAGEPIFGTATEVKFWLLLEYREPWRAKAEDDNDLPARIQSFLTEQLTAIPDSRLLFVKQQHPVREELKVFAVSTDESAPALYEFELESYDDLLALDFTGIGAVSSRRREEPLFLACTNTKRDKCCAKFGIPAFQALQESQGEAAWQCSHIGGHRYAPNILFLPHSVNYGFLSPEEIGPAAVTYRDGRLYDLDHYRGRTYYAPHVQAADYFLRQELSLYDLAAVRLRSAELVAKDTWRVRFDIPATGEGHQLELISRVTEEPRLTSCSPSILEPVPRYQLLGHQLI
jgi:hypothetical protein